MTERTRSNRMTKRKKVIEKNRKIRKKDEIKCDTISGLVNRIE